MTGEFLTPVRSFNDLGIAAVRRLLERMRKEGKFLPDAIELLLADPTYAELVPDVAPINRTLEFKTKLELATMLYDHFNQKWLESNRGNVGVWTWLAMAYSDNFIVKGKVFTKIVTDTRWVYDPSSNLVARRHFVAGIIYLYLDFRSSGEEIVDMNFCGPVYQFNTITDVVTHYNSLMQNPAALTVAGWLYHDPKSAKRIKRGAAGHIRHLAQFADRVMRTWDVYDVDSASRLWRMLPKGFDAYKGAVEH